MQLILEMSLWLTENAERSSFRHTYAVKILVILAASAAGLEL